MCIWTGFFFRILAVLAAQGMSFGFDHYVYVENAQQIVSGELSAHELCTNPVYSYFFSHGHSLIYLYLNSTILYICELLHFFDARSKMFVIRLIHALISMLVIYYSYRITYRLANRKAALAVGLLTSMLWFMPFGSVMTIPENLAAIFVLASIYRLAKTRRRTYKIADDIFTGFMLGLSVSFCYTLMILIIGVGIVFVIISRPKRGALLLFGATMAVAIAEGLVDAALLGSPFYMIRENTAHMISGVNATTGARAVYMYFSMLLFVIPLPWSLCTLFGFAKSWKRSFLLFVPLSIYILGIYLLPHKEEKFMMPILPVFFILGASGWYAFKSESRFWTSHPRISKWSVYLFFIINTPVLCLASTAYTRKPQIETMLYLSRFQQDVSSVFVEDSGHTVSKGLPTFYLGKSIMIYWLHKQETEPDKSIYYSCIVENASSREIYTEKFFKNPQLDSLPEFVVFYGDYNLDTRLSRVREIFPNLTFERTLQPSLADRVIQFCNPSNYNLNLHVYRVN